jgi:hypothetical protein
VVAIPLFLLTKVRSEAGLRWFTLEPGTGKRLTTETFQLGLNVLI